MASLHRSYVTLNYDFIPLPEQSSFARTLLYDRGYGRFCYACRTCLLRSSLSMWAEGHAK